MHGTFTAMGIMKKLFPKKAPALISKGVATVQPLLNGSGAESYQPMEFSSAAVAGEPAGDDDPTWFTTLMVMYYGFFGITLLVYPNIHAVDNGLFKNPVAYWSTLSEDLEFGFRMLGAAFTAIVLGPFTSVSAIPHPHSLGGTRAFCSGNRRSDPPPLADAEP